jgi:hypothetical protein
MVKKNKQKALLFFYPKMLSFISDIQIYKNYINLN